MSKFFFFIIILLITSCSLQKQTLSNKGEKSELQRLKEFNSFRPASIYIEGEGSVKMENQKLDFNFSLNSKRDSIVLISIKGPFGIEFFRVKVLPEKIFLIDRTQKTYIEESFSYLNTFFKTSFNFKDLNNIIYVNKKDERLEKNMIEKKDRFIISTSTSESKYLIDPESPNLLDTIIRNNEEYSCELFNFKEENGIVFPFNLILRLKNQFVLELKYKRILFDKQKKFLFKIPQDYAK